MTLDARCVQSILAAVEASGWDEIVVGVGDSVALRISRVTPGSSTVEQVLPATQSVISSPSIGIFEPLDDGSVPFAVGTVVPAGGVVGTVIASTLQLPVQSNTGGVVVATHVVPGEVVEYGTPVVTLDVGRGKS